MSEQNENKPCCPEVVARILEWTQAATVDATVGEG